MYCPPLFREDRIDVLHDFIRGHPLGLLISHESTGLLANLLPFELKATEGERGKLHAHIARANPQWRELDGQPVLIVFRGTDAYVSPSLYATKRETGKVVPTWNYTMVQVRGTVQLRDRNDWVAAQIQALTNAREASRAKPWAVTDAPLDYVETQMKHIVGIEIAIDAVEGKWKVSQNQPEENRRSVIAGFSNDDSTLAMAGLVRSYGKIDP